MNSLRVVYFDGVCGLCNGFVNRLIRGDRRRMLRFAPLQGLTARDRLGATALAATDTLIYERDGVLFQRSDGVLRIAADVGGVLRLLLVFRLLPRAFRDRGYDFVARNRYRWFGRRDTCRLPTPEEVGVFLP